MGLLFLFPPLIFGPSELVQKLLQLGVMPSQSDHEQRLIRTVNFLNLVVAVSLAIGFTNYFFLGTEFPLPFVSTFFLLSLVSLFLSFRHRTRSSFVLFTLNVNLSIFFINEYYPAACGAYLFYYPLIVSVVLLNNPSIKDPLSVVHLVMCLLFLTTSLIVEFPELRVAGLSEEQQEMLWYYNLLISAAITTVLSVLLTRVISRQTREIVQQHDSLLHAKELVDASLKEKELLLAELHHRVKNNLAIIAGLLNLQEDATANEEARRIISDSRTRIMSMAMVHRMLYENQDLKRIRLSRYTSELVYELFNSANLLKTVEVDEAYDDIVLPVNKSIPLGLILNEIVTNTIKYAFRGMKRGEGRLTIRIREAAGGHVEMTVKDNGRGFATGQDFAQGNYSLGLYLIRTLTEQLDGDVRFSNENGAKVEIVFPR